MFVSGQPAQGMCFLAMCLGSWHGELLGAIGLLPGWTTAARRGLEVAIRVDEQLPLALSVSQEMPKGLQGSLLLPNFFCPHPGARCSKGSGLRGRAALPVGELGPVQITYRWLRVLILASCSLGNLDAQAFLTYAS